MTILGRQPAVWIGIIVSCILAVLSVLTGEGVINDAVAGRITDGLTALSQLAVLLAPLITGLLIRPNVTPVASPSLPAGTEVKNPAAPEGDQPPPDLIVVNKEQFLNALNPIPLASDFRPLPGDPDPLYPPQP